MKALQIIITRLILLLLRIKMVYIVRAGTGGTVVRRKDFLALIAHHNIPDDYVNIIWNAMVHVPKAPAVREDLDGVFATPPTFEEFLDSISSRTGKTAGGFTDLTYEHMKAWSLTFKRKVFDNLIAIWDSSHAPEWWKWRWLSPIPKTPGDTTMAGQRGIMLVEVLRKTWISLIIYRINQCWNRHDILHPSQHGFRSRRGTDTALLGL
jgi:hypothetical protein